LCGSVVEFVPILKILGLGLGLLLYFITFGKCCLFSVLFCIEFHWGVLGRFSIGLEGKIKISYGVRVSQISVGSLPICLC